MRMVKWMCDIKVKDRVPNKELRETLGFSDIISILQQTGCDGMGMCCKKKTMIRVNKYMEYEVEGARARCRTKRTWREVVQKACQTHKLNGADAMDCSRWRRLIKDD